MLNMCFLVFLTPFSNFAPVMELLELSPLCGVSPSRYGFAPRFSNSSISCISYVVLNAYDWRLGRSVQGSLSIGHIGEFSII